jgi:S-DNA-T family DNA segregation ATPase FtsK/SpoIIIE
VGNALLPPGRGFTREGRELQLAWVGPEALAERASAAAAEYPDQHAPPVTRVPAHVRRSDLPPPAAPLEAVLGLDADRLQPVVADLTEHHLLVAGPRRAGTSTALATVACSLRAGGSGLALHLLAPRRTPLLGLEQVWTSTAQGPDACAALAGELASGDEEPLVVVLDDGLELAEGAGSAALERLLRRGRDGRVRLVAGVDANGVQRIYGGWLRDLRAERTGLLLQPGTDTADVLGVRLPPVAGPLPPGRGFLVERGAARLVQIAGS